MAKMDKKWVVLCSTAIAAVYASGYFSTEAQANKIALQQPASMAVASTGGNPTSTVLPNASQTNGGKHPSHVNQAHGTQTKTKSSTTVKAKKPQVKRIYKDGTFNGMGQNRRGSIAVAVTLKNDKITNVQISNFAMHYSESDVVGLPGEVVQKQNAQVTNVSGATYSTQAFADAVQTALNQAKNA